MRGQTKRLRRAKCNIRTVRKIRCNSCRLSHEIDKWTGRALRTTRRSPQSMHGQRRFSGKPAVKHATYATGRSTKASGHRIKAARNFKLCQSAKNAKPTAVTHTHTPPSRFPIETAPTTFARPTFQEGLPQGRTIEQTARAYPRSSSILFRRFLFSFFYVSHTLAYSLSFPPSISLPKTTSTPKRSKDAIAPDVTSSAAPTFRIVQVVEDQNVFEEDRRQTSDGTAYLR